MIGASWRRRLLQPWRRKQGRRLIDRLAAPQDDLLQVLVQQSGIGVLIIDRQGRIQWRSTGPMTPDQRTALMKAAGQH